MNTIKINGRTYAAVEVEENNLCAGCIFYSTGWNKDTPICEAVDIPELACDDYTREDGKNVIFKLMANNVAEK